MKIKLFFLTLLSLFVASCTSQKPVNKNETSLLAEEKLYCSSKNKKALGFYQTAYTAVQKKDFLKAKLYYQKAIEADPAYCDAMDNLGRLYRVEGKVKEAIKLYEKSLEISPANLVALINLAVAYRFDNQVQKAIETYQRLMNLEPSNPEGYYGIGTIYMAQERFSEAIPYLLKADQIYIDINSQYIHHTGYLLGEAYFKQGKCSDSIFFMDRSYENYANDLEANFYLGLCYLTKPFYSPSHAIIYLNKVEKAGGVLSDKIKNALTSKTPIHIEVQK